MHHLVAQLTPSQLQRARCEQALTRYYQLQDADASTAEAWKVSDIDLQTLVSSQTLMCQRVQSSFQDLLDMRSDKTKYSL